MKSKENFDKAMQRAEHFIQLYDLLKNERERAPRSTWAKKFKTFMGWKQSTKIMKIEGKDSLLVIKNPSAGLTYDRFEHEYVAELLRSSIVASVSAMDKYMHDHAVDKCYSLLTGPEKNIPNKLLQFELPALETFKAMKKIKADASARPGGQLKQALQKKLHKSTFQGANDIDLCMALMSVKKFWSDAAAEIGNGETSKTLKTKINNIVQRRNYIVHEADIERKVSAKKIVFRQIKRKEAHDAVTLIKTFVDATEEVLKP